MSRIENIDWQYERPCTWAATLQESKQEYNRISNIRLELVTGELFRVTGNGFVQFECHGLDNAKTKAGIMVAFISNGSTL